MKLWLNCLAASLVLVILGSYVWLHRRHVANAVAAPNVVQTPEQDYAEKRDAKGMVEVNGPLANLALREKASDAATVETLRPAAYKGFASDRVNGLASPAGTSATILHETFAVGNIVNLPFELPAHAATPQLRGTFRSFVKKAGAETSDSTADVEFLVLTQAQYDDFLNGHVGEAVFSADAGHQQEVNCRMPPTFGQAVKYFLVFRNPSATAGKKFVEADFRIDF